jgi:hypothetical protein
MLTGFCLCCTNKTRKLFSLFILKVKVRGVLLFCDESLVSHGGLKRVEEEAAKLGHTVLHVRGHTGIQLTKQNQMRRMLFCFVCYLRHDCGELGNRRELKRVDGGGVERHAHVARRRMLQKIQNKKRRKERKHKEKTYHHKRRFEQMVQSLFNSATKSTNKNTLLLTR